MFFIPAGFVSSLGIPTMLGIVSSTGSTDSATITAPRHVLVGDLMVMIDYSNDISLGAAVIPSGWTSVGIVQSTEQRIIVSYKIANGTEGSTTITGTSDYVTCKVILLYRADGPIKSLEVSTPVSVAPTSSTPATQTITASSGIAPVIGVTISAGDDNDWIIGQTTSIPTHYIQGAGGTDYGCMTIKSTIQKTNPVNYTFYMPDEGSRNTLFGFYFHNIKCSQLFTKATTLNFITSTTAEGSSNITCPTVQTGDLLIHYNHAGQYYDPSCHPLPNFMGNVFVTLNYTNSGFIMSSCIAHSSMSGVSLRGLDADNWWDGHMMAVFRGNIPLRVVESYSTYGAESSSNPSPQTVTSSSGTVPLVVAGGYGAEFTISPRTFTVGGVDGKSGEVGNGGMWLAWRIFNSSPQDVIVDMDDESGSNLLSSFYVAVA